MKFLVFVFGCFAYICAQQPATTQPPGNDEPPPSPDEMSSALEAKTSTIKLPDMKAVDETFVKVKVYNQELKITLNKDKTKLDVSDTGVKFYVFFSEIKHESRVAVSMRLGKGNNLSTKKGDLRVTLSDMAITLNGAEGSGCSCQTDVGKAKIEARHVGDKKAKKEAEKDRVEREVRKKIEGKLCDAMKATLNEKLGSSPPC